MAEVGTRSSMTSNHGRGRGHAHHHHVHARTCHIHRRHNNYVAFSHISLLTSLLLLYIPSYVTISLIPFYTTHAPCPPQQHLPSGNNKTIHNQGVGERSEPHSLYIYISLSLRFCCKFTRNSFQYFSETSSFWLMNY